MVISRGWSSVTLGKAGTFNENQAFFKHVKYELTEEKTKDNSRYVDGIWIYKPSGAKKGIEESKPLKAEPVADPKLNPVPVSKPVEELK